MDFRSYMNETLEVQWRALKLSKLLEFLFKFDEFKRFTTSKHDTHAYQIKSELCKPTADIMHVMLMVYSTQNNAHTHRSHIHHKSRSNMCTNYWQIASDTIRAQVLSQIIFYLQGHPCILTNMARQSQEFMAIGMHNVWPYIPATIFAWRTLVKWTRDGGISEILAWPMSGPCFVSRCFVRIF